MAARAGGGRAGGGGGGGGGGSSKERPPSFVTSSVLSPYFMLEVATNSVALLNASRESSMSTSRKIFFPIVQRALPPLSGEVQSRVRFLLRARPLARARRARLLTRHAGAGRAGRVGAFMRVCSVQWH